MRRFDRRAFGGARNQPGGSSSRNGLIAQLKKRVVERALGRGIDASSGVRQGEAPEEGRNHRNGYSEKTSIGEDGAMEIEVPRDRSGSFEPLLMPRGRSDLKVLMRDYRDVCPGDDSERDMQAFLLEQYRVEVSADFISTVTDSVMEAVVEWQNRPLERCIR